MNAAKEDPIREIRAIRQRLSAEFGHDMKRIGEHLMEFQKEFGDALVTSDKLEARKRARRG